MFAPEVVEAVALAVSEAVGNVVRHAYPDNAGTFQISAAADEEWLHVAITDQGGGRAEPSLNPGQGLGLAIMREMADARIHDLERWVQVALRFPCTAR